jgi:hypothetical protein
MTSDMLAFNDIYRSAAHDNGGEFIDIWDGFDDEHGAFVTTGPDINGQPVRLRSDDGINITKAGKRKLAFYTEKPLMKILGLSTPDAAGASHVPAGEPVKEPEAGAPPAAVDRTVPMLLSDPALDGGTELLGAVPAGNTGLRPGEERAVTETAPDAAHGRADDFSGPPQGSRQGQAAKVASPVETTTAISP